MAISDYYLTPGLSKSEDDMKRKMALALLMQGTSGEPIKSWTQALARAAQGAIGGYSLYNADQADRDRETKIQGAINSLPGMSPAGQRSDATDAVPASPVAAALMPSPSGSYGNNTVATNSGNIPLPPPDPLGRLSPQMRDNFPALRTAAAAQGVNFDAPDIGSLGGVRTPQQQQALYAQGRTAPGPVVTGTLNSNHLTGNALDVVPTNGTNEGQVGKVVQALISSDPRFAGMRSGASFSNLYDPLHVEQNVKTAGYQQQPSPQQPTQLAGPVPTPDSALPPGAQPVQQQGYAPQPQIRGPVMTPQQQQEIRVLMADPATRAIGMQKYQQYSTPKEQEVPLVNPQERIAAGIDKGDTSPYQRNSVTGKISAINNRPQVNVNNQAESTFEKTYGEAQGKGAAGVVEAGDKASGVYQNNQVLRQLNSAIQGGKITPTQATIGAWAQSIGIDPKALGIAPSLPTNAQTFTALSNQSMMSKLGPGGFPSQNFSDTDRKFLEKTVTNLGDTPQANALKLDISDRISQLQMEKADKWQEISTSVAPGERAGAYERFERDWRKEIKSRNVFGDLVNGIAPEAPTTTGPAQSAPNIIKYDAQGNRIQ